MNTEPLARAATLGLGIVGAAVLALIGLPSSATAADYTFRLHSFAPPASLDHSAHIDPWAERIEKASDGRIAIEVYPSMQLGGKAGDLVSQLEDGVVDIIFTLPGFTPGRFPGAQGLEMPFMNTGLSTTMSPAAMEFITGHLQPEFDGIYVASVHATDGSLIHTKDRPIKTLEDFKGLKLRVAGRFIGEAVKAMGATPVGIPLPGVYEALSRGQVDGMLINWAITVPFRFWEVTSHHTDHPIYQSMLMLLMSQDSYDRLPADLQAVVDSNSGVDHAIAMGKVWDGFTAAARQETVDNGNNVFTLPEDEVARWKQAVTPAYDVWAEEMSSRGYDGQALLQTLKDITAKHGRE